MHATREFYEDYWAEGKKSWSPRFVAIDPVEHRLILKYLLPGRRVLDCGAGDGSHYGNLIRSLKVDYFPMDISLVANQRCKAEGYAPLNATLDNILPFASDCLDIVLCFEVLEHLLYPATAVREMYRVLKPGGISVISVPNTVYLPNRMLFMFGMFNPGGSPLTALKAPWQDPHIRFFTKSTLKKLFHEANFLGIEMTGRFSLMNFPILYRMRRLTHVLDRASKPFYQLGHFWPSLLSHRLFAVFGKPE